MANFGLNNPQWELMEIIDLLGLVAAVLLPLWNVPLILRIRQRRSSQDLSLWWVFGVWMCLLLMLPSGLQSSDMVFRVFTIVNAVLFTAVVGYVVRYR